MQLYQFIRKISIWNRNQSEFKKKKRQDRKESNFTALEAISKN